MKTAIKHQGTPHPANIPVTRATPMVTYRVYPGEFSHAWVGERVVNGRREHSVRRATQAAADTAIRQKRPDAPRFIDSLPDHGARLTSYLAGLNVRRAA